MNGQTALLLAKAWRRDKMITTLRAAIERKLESPPTPEEAFFEAETLETPADTTQFSWTDDEVSGPKREVSSGDETGTRVAYDPDKLEGHRRSWWQSLLKSEPRNLRHDRGLDYLRL